MPLHIYILVLEYILRCFRLIFWTGTIIVITCAKMLRLSNVPYNTFIHSLQSFKLPCQIWQFFLQVTYPWQKYQQLTYQIIVVHLNHLYPKNIMSSTKIWLVLLSSVIYCKCKLLKLKITICLFKTVNC